MALGLDLLIIWMPPGGCINDMKNHIGRAERLPTFGNPDPLNFIASGRPDSGRILKAQHHVVEGNISLNDVPRGPGGRCYNRPFGVA